MLSFTFSARSSNEKTGPMPVTTTSRASCWQGCAFYEAGCYAKYNKLGLYWSKLTETEAGTTFQNGVAKVKTYNIKGLCEAIAALPEGTLWRHNQAGDLPSENGEIDVFQLGMIVKANEGKCGFTYTHHPVLDEQSPYALSNRASVAMANKNGFTVNLSANDLGHADKLADLGIAPVVTVLPSTVHGNERITTPAGRRVVVCPATYRDDVTCKSCGLCQKRGRKCIVGFPAHGAGKRRVDTVITHNGEALH